MARQKAISSYPFHFILWEFEFWSLTPLSAISQLYYGYNF